MRFIDQGSRFVCNLCGHTSETPQAYQCNLGPDGRRRDADSRPELSRGTIEFVAPKEYQVGALILFSVLVCYGEAAQVSGCVATLLLLLMSIFIWQNAGPSSNATSVFLPDRCVNDSCFKWGCGGSLQCC
jgi:hypothetical protein